MKMNKYIFSACCNFILMIFCGYISINYFIWGSIELYLTDDYLFSMKQMIYHFLCLMSAFLCFAFFIGWKTNANENKKNYINNDNKKN